MAPHNTSNIILIGMPGAGKSTLGKLLAQSFGLEFVDTDTLLAEALKMPLQQYIDTHGQQSFRMLEDTLVANLHVQGCVIATGGSVVYGKKGMANLTGSGVVVYLHAGEQELQKRITAQPRAIVWPQGQSFQQLFAERDTLYRHYATIVLDTQTATPEQTVAQLAARFPRH
ncbi:MAG TPA: shikimate kinase [Alphaproteobacteria bacterium]|nr:shikimate kinase [Alphaproteobacteria bacterium]